MAIRDQLIELFETIFVEGFQKIDAFRNACKGFPVTRQNKVYIQITYLIKTIEKFLW